MARDIDPPQIRFSIMAARRIQTMWRGSSMHTQYKDFLVTESASTDHRRTTNLAVLTFRQCGEENRSTRTTYLSRLLERSKRCGVVLRQVGGIECIWGHAGFKLQCDAPRCVGSMCGSCRHGGYKRTGEGNRLTGSIETSSLHAAFNLRFESSDYTSHTPSSGRQGEFKAVSVARTLRLRLFHTSLRRIQTTRRSRMPTERTRHTLHPDLSRQCGAVDSCDVPLSYVLQQGVSRPIGFVLQVYVAARRIQTVWRASMARRAYQHFVNARTIQMCWRQSVARVALIKILAARGIQAFGRCHLFRKPYHEYICARRIQTF
jgi:hypothetical protein